MSLVFSHCLRTPILWGVVVTAALAHAGCRSQTPPAPEQPIEASQLPKIAVKAARKLLYTYYDRSEKLFESASKLQEIPEAARSWVRVVDLDLRPAARRDHELVYVADLRQPKADGHYPYVVLSRRAFEERAVSGVSARPGPAVAPEGGVVLYATAWCPACKAARRWLTDNKVPFVEKDVEKDPAAAEELMQRARAAGLSTSGVPVLDIRGNLIQGFDPERIRALLRGTK